MLKHVHAFGYGWHTLVHSDLWHYKQSQDPVLQHKHRDCCKQLQCRHTHLHWHMNECQYLYILSVFCTMHVKAVSVSTCTWKASCNDTEIPLQCWPLRRSQFEHVQGNKHHIDKLECIWHLIDRLQHQQGDRDHKRCVTLELTFAALQASH